MIKLKLNELLTNLDGSQVIYTSYKSGQKVEAGYKFCNILYDFKITVCNCIFYRYNFIIFFPHIKNVCTYTYDI